MEQTSNDKFWSLPYLRNIYTKFHGDGACFGASQGLSGRVHLPMQEMQETEVWSLGGEDPLEEEMATHSSILAKEIPWTEEPGRL